ncbi:thioredoxin-dependent thiol peroxidase [Kocuria sp.]|uniref:thioredoxin-dependent thiol peroxidase n=1 Tax=Kocuria sp. TaxID=1871328 RepID=UPI0037BF2676
MREHCYPTGRKPPVTTTLTAGDTAPAFTLQDANGDDVSLGDYRGRRVIVYFYPKAATPGCTTQACDFRDNLARFTADGFAVLGISPDAPTALARFTDKQELTFPLLSDQDHSVAEAYGAWGEKKNYGKTYEGLIRSTVVVDAQGVVELAQYNVRAKGHVARLRRDLHLD